MQTEPHAGIEAADIVWLHALARRLAGPQDADDLAQEVWLAARQHPPETSRSTRPWLRTVLRNRWRMGRRSQARSEARERRREPDAPSVPTIDDALHREQVLSRLRDALARLGPADREVIGLRIVEELDTEAAASRLGIAPVAVRARLSRALERTRVELDHAFGEREAWMGAFVAIPGLLPASHAIVGETTGTAVATATTTATTTATIEGMAMATSTKIAMGAVLITALVGSGWWVARADAGVPAEPLAPAAADDRGADAAATVVAAPADTRAEARTRWDLRRAAIAEARRRRESRAAENVTTLVAAAPRVSPGYATRTALRKAMFSEAYHSIGDCVEEAARRGGGRVEFDVRVVGEPGLGAVIDDVALTTETDADPAVRDCLLEGAPAFDVSAIDIDVEQVFHFEADLSAATLAVSAEIPLPNTADIEAYLASLSTLVDDAEVERRRALLLGQGDRAVVTEGYMVAYDDE